MIDANLVMSQEQTATSTTPSTNIIDLGPQREYVAQGDDLVIHCVVAEDFAGTGGLLTTLQGCDTEGGTYENLMVSSDMGIHQLTKGRPILSGTLPKVMLTSAGNPIRFLRMNYGVVGSPTAGKVSAYIDLVPAKPTRRRMVS